MSKLLKISGNEFKILKNNSGGGDKYEKIVGLSSQKINKLILEIGDQIIYWKNDQIIKPYCLIEIWYENIVPKSSKVTKLFFQKEDESVVSTVGCRYEKVNDKEITVYTHFLNVNILQKSLDELIEVQKFLNVLCGNNFVKIDISLKKQITELDPNYFNSVKKTNFLTKLLDLSNVKSIKTKLERNIHRESRIISLYKTSLNTYDILQKLDIKEVDVSIFENNNILVNDEVYSKLIENVPYLIAMDVTDLFSIASEIEVEGTDDDLSLSPPTEKDTHVIGVLDTLFDTNVYFNDWVEFETTIDSSITNFNDMIHGTKVTSIIVDGPRFNPLLDDKCGNFKVKHFGITTSGPFSSFEIVKTIKKIVNENLHIKVWNLSLGSIFEIDSDSISFIASFLDELQVLYDIIFIVAGTNITTTMENFSKIGSPADSMNSLVVNSVRNDNTATSYVRKGPVLKYHIKPDVSYYGGDEDEPIKTYFCQITESYGTSFAAPWITRKIAYLIYKMNFTREAAKALIVNSAYNNFPSNKNDVHQKGFGVVPIDINDVLNSHDNEILFYIEDKIEEKKILSEAIVLPTKYENTVDKEIYAVSVTLTYFTSGRRNFGIDYIDNDISLKFGKVQKNDKGNNIFDDKLKTEMHLRKNDQKWSNVKVLKFDKKRKTDKKEKWAIQLESTPRNQTREKFNPINFCLVVRLIPIINENNYNIFIDEMKLEGWTVLEIDNLIEIDNSIEIQLEV